MAANAEVSRGHDPALLEGIRLYQPELLRGQERLDRGSRRRQRRTVERPLAGLEPATYGLEVRHDPSVWWQLGLSLLVDSGPWSRLLHPGWGRYSDRIARRIATITHLLGDRTSEWLGGNRRDPTASR